jgi:hypothetical protein
VRALTVDGLGGADQSPMRRSDTINPFSGPYVGDGRLAHRIVDQVFAAGDGVEH